MLTIKYDAVNGVAVPDGQAEQYAREVVTLHNSSPRDETVTVSNGLVVDAFRLMVSRKVIHHTEIQFMYNDQVIAVDERGHLKLWPAGFCDYFRSFVVEIMRNKRDKDKPC